MKPGWEIKKLGEVFTLKAGKSISSDNIKPDGGEKMYPCFGGNGIRGYVDTYIAEGAYPIIGRVGALCGNIQLSQGKFYATEHAIVAYIKSNDIKAEWAALALKSLNLRQYAKGVAQPVISAGQLAELSIPVPPLKEQERIVAELDCLSGVIEKKKQQLKELDALAQSIFYQMFGNPITNEKGWTITPLSNKVKVKGRVGWKGYKKEDLRDNGPLAIGGGHLTDNGEIDLSKPVFLSMEKYLESPEIMVEVGDIILVQRGTIGKVGLIANYIGEATINPCVLILRPDNLSSVYLLHYFLNASTQMHLKTLIKGVAQPMITQQQVNELSLPIPSFTLQQEFADKIEAIEKQKELIKQSIAQTEELFNSRMDYYFN